jgi:Ca2+-dependent lipid-binding protein
MLEVGKNLNLEVRKLFFSCKLRVELGPLIAMSPTFGAVSLSFMGKPKVDFSFKIGGLDMMSVGIASTDFSVATLVGDYMKSCLGFMVYPKKYIIPMVDDVDIDKLVKVIPVGILKLTIVSAKDLIVADFLAKSSDPYVVIKFMDNKLKTRTIFKNLNPTWSVKLCAWSLHCPLFIQYIMIYILVFCLF